jgi:hypothetical protein
VTYGAIRQVQFQVSHVACAKQDRIGPAQVKSLVQRFSRIFDRILLAVKQQNQYIKTSVDVP